MAPTACATVSTSSERSACVTIGITPNSPNTFNSASLMVILFSAKVELKAVSISSLCIHVIMAPTHSGVTISKLYSVLNAMFPNVSTAYLRASISKPYKLIYSQSLHPLGVEGPIELELPGINGSGSPMLFSRVHSSGRLDAISINAVCAFAFINSL